MACSRSLLMLSLAAALIGLSACKTATPDAAVSADKVDSAPDATAGAGAAAGEATGEATGGAEAPADGAPDAEDGGEAGARNLDLTDVALPAGGGSYDVALTATAGQTLTAMVTGVSLGSVQLDLLGPEDDVLASSAEAPPTERNVLQAAITTNVPHVLRIRSAAGAPALSFDLTVTVDGEAAGEGTAAGGSAGEATSGAGTPAPPKRIAFQAGAAGGSIKGQMAGAGETQGYLLGGSKDEILSVTLTADPAGAVDVMVFSPSGKPLRPLMPGEALGPQRFPLPEDGDYLITLSASSPASWTLDLILEDAEPAGGAAAVPAGAPPTRVIFGPGNRATRLQGQVGGLAPQRYVLHAGAGDTLALSLESDAGVRPQVFVEDSRGRVLASGLTAQAMTVPLPASEDYWVTVLVTPQSDAVSYAMTIGLQ